MAFIRVRPIDVHVRTGWFDGRPREVTLGDERLPVTRLAAVREEAAAYPVITGPRTGAGHLFALLDNPTKHPLFDGSGTVRASRAPDRHLHKGDRFAMAMRYGLPYRITNRNVEYEANRLIAWAHFGGHRWRFQLEAAVQSAHVVRRRSGRSDWSAIEQLYGALLALGVISGAIIDHIHRLYIGRRLSDNSCDTLCLIVCRNDGCYAHVLRE